MGQQKPDSQRDQEEAKEQENRTTESSHKAGKGQILLQLL